LEKNLRLAKELGAEVVTSADTDLVDGLLQIARRNNVSQIIIGKPAKYNFLNYLKKDNYVDRLIQNSGNIDIYIVRPPQVKNKEVKRPKEIKFNSALKDYFYSAISVILLASICFPLKDYIGYQSVGLILLLNLLILPFYVGRGPIMVSALLNYLIWNFFFIPPLFTFEIGKLHDVLTLLLNLVIALTSGYLSTKIRKQKQLVQLREKNTIALLNFTKELSNCKSKYDAISIALKHIDLNFDVNATFFDEYLEPQISTGDILQFGKKEITIAKWCLENNSTAGKFTNNLPDATGQYFPIVTNRKKIGVICLLIMQKLAIEDENLINNIITQLSGVYEKEETAEQIKLMSIESESKKLYDTLLDSISHEFRTPIAVISGSATSIMEGNIADNQELVANFANEIYIASKRLNLLVENLLDITRLESGKMKLNKQAHSIHELINDVLSQLKETKKNHTLSLHYCSENPVLNFDYGFLSQAVFNILYNAFIYTPPGSDISITTSKSEDKFIISISDNGNGLNEDDMGKLFDKFYRPSGTQAGGTGLGLSIAKGFIEAHSGSIKVRKNEPNGLIFDISLPLNE
jgi:two-component system sensor histidine kinase KdpD